MNLIKNIYYKYSHYLEKLDVIDLEKDGSLKILKKKGKSRYFYCYKPEGNFKEKYLSLENLSFIKKLAQRSYNKKVSKLLKKRIFHFKSMLDYKNNEIDDIYEGLSESRKSLVKPIVPTFNQKLQYWKSKEYITLEFNESQKNFLTKNGEYVRSKSEKILADLFFDMGIVYKYECQVILKNGKAYYPDFTFLSPYTHEEIYWEHFGVMDNETYSRNSISKLNTYFFNGIKQTENLIVTMETSNTPLNTKYAEELAKKFLI